MTENSAVNVGQEASAKDKHLAVGLGCLWFYRADLSSDNERFKNFDYNEHCNLISRQLEALPNISNINVAKPEISMLRVNAASDGDEEYDFFPFVNGLSISFDIHIPFRIQKELVFRMARLPCEDFSVQIKYDNDTPVAYIYFEADSFHISPSDSIVAVRKFLENHFSRVESGIEFRTLGPSPFHADIFLVPASDPDMDQIFRFDDESYPGVGYKDYRFSYPMTTFSDTQQAIKAFHAIFGESISCYYNSVLHRNKLLILSRFSEEMLTDLLDVQTRSGISGWFKRLTKAPQISRDLMISILQEQIIKRNFDSYVKNAKRNEALLPGTPFEKHVEQELDDVVSTPISDVRETVSIFEERYLKNIENGTVLIAGLIGGILGSLITYLLAK